MKKTFAFSLILALLCSNLLASETASQAQGTGSEHKTSFLSRLNPVPFLRDQEERYNARKKEAKDRALAQIRSEKKTQ